MSLLKDYATDPQAVKDGVWVDFGNDMIRVRPIGVLNPKFAAAIAKLLAPYHLQMQSDSFDESVLELPMNLAFCTHVITDWQTRVDGEMVQGMEGEAGPYDIQKAAELLSNPLMAVVKQKLKNRANNESLYMANLQEESAKN